MSVRDQRMFLLYPGIYHDRRITEADLSHAKRNFWKNQSYADELFWYDYTRWGTFQSNQWRRYSEPEPEPECNPDDHIRDNDHRCTDHDDQYQSADDCDRTSDPAGIYGTDFCNRKTLTEILQKPAGISGTYQWSGRRSIWRT